jgi:hypothetical protein
MLSSGATSGKDSDNDESLMVRMSKADTNARRTALYITLAIMFATKPFGHGRKLRKENAMRIQAEVKSMAGANVYYFC